MVHRIAFPPLNPDRGRRIATASTAHTNRTGRSACPTTPFEPGRTNRLRRRALEHFRAPEEFVREDLRALEDFVQVRLYANLVAMRRAARESIKREIPLKSMLTPTRVPIAHSVLHGQVLQIRKARITLTIASNRIQPAPVSVRSQYKIMNSRSLSIQR